MSAVARLNSMDRQSSTDEGRRGELKLASPFGDMLEAVKNKAQIMDLWSEEMQRDLPKKWEKHGNMIIFPQNSFTHKNWRFIGRDLWRVIAESLKVDRLGKKRIIDERTPHVDLLYGVDGWVEHVDEKGVRYIYDASKRVFNIEKTKEMKRIREMDTHGETVVDMYAGLGYFTFPFAASCGAKKVYAIDWDEDTVEALLRSRSVNGLDEVVEVIQGDARKMVPLGVADRVYLGLTPSCHAHLLTAAKALSRDGGIVHVQDVVHPTKPRPPRPVRKPLINIISKLESVEEGRSDESKDDSNEKEKKEVDTVDDNYDDTQQPPTKPKLTRSASIIEELENRQMPTPTVNREFEPKWKKLPQPHRDFVIECCESLTRFLNNIHEHDELYSVRIVNVTKLSSSSIGDNIVADLVCAKDDSSASRFTSKLLWKDEKV